MTVPRIVRIILMMMIPAVLAVLMAGGNAGAQTVSIIRGFGATGSIAYPQGPGGRPSLRG